ncbi:hypothetical protein QF028_001707 [Neobacillus sp. B4I6]|uniref:hypothetical protein n=1 Tax=Neobacillus sp. B4I6 TaxID=3373925 RepID=UPI003D1F12E2
MEKAEKNHKTLDNQGVISFSANKKWLSMPVEIRRKLEQNVWCGSCSDVVKIESYTVKEFSNVIVLEGICHKCGNEVARVID